MTSSTCLKYSVPSRSVAHNIPPNAPPSTSTVAAILIYRCVIRTSGNEPRREPLNRVRAGLVAPLAACDVPRDVGTRERRELHRGHLDAARVPFAAADAHAGHHLVTSAGQSPQHHGGLVVVSRLAED